MLMSKIVRVYMGYLLGVCFECLEQTWLESSGKRKVLEMALVDWGNFELLSCCYPPMGVLTLRVIPKTLKMVPALALHATDIKRV